MQEHAGLPYLRETLLFLTLSGLLIPLLLRFRMNQVLGFLAVGALLGPHGLGLWVERLPWLAWVTFPRAEGVAAFAELGVLSLMFMIGLEVSVARLWALRRWVFDAGLAQVAITAIAVGAAMRAIGLGPSASALLGLVLALSSTAVVMQLMDSRQAVGTPMGQAVFSILLLQDLAAVPLLVLVGLLAEGGDGSAFAWTMGLTLAKALAAVAAIFLVGRRLVRPVFVSFARSHQPDVFMALTLLAALGIAGLTHAAGLSAALGAFLAGLLLAETQYRHAVEVTIEPFRGLLMGLFFMSIGMAVDLRVLLADPARILAAVAALMALKAVVAAGVLRAGGLPLGRAVEGGLLLSQGGEFAMIVVGAAMAARVVDPRFGADVLLAVALTMFATPLADRLGRAIAARLETRRPGLAAPPDAPAEDDLRGHVIVAGFGRVGRLLADVFRRRGVRFVALESDPALVADAHAQGLPVYYGDASRADMLRRLHARDAAAVVLTMDDAASALHAVAAVRADYPLVPVFARARDEAHAALLAEAGATLVTPETLEAGLQLATFALQALGDAEAAANAVIDAERQRRIGAIAVVPAQPAARPTGPESPRP